MGMRAVRVYQGMEYHPAPAYLNANHRPTPAGFSVRSMNSDGDVFTLTNLQNAAFEGSWGYEPNTAEDIEASLRLPGLGHEWVRLVCDESDVAAAYVWTKFEPSDGMSIGHIGMVGVHPNYRRRGLGTVAAAAGIRLLRDAGAGLIRLEVDRENKPARRVYRDLGFRKVSDQIWYELSLVAP
jgi:mycothiol synthase